MQQIRPDVFKALCTFPVQEFVQGKANSLGDSFDDQTNTYLGYYYEGFEKVLNNSGVEELSHVQIYLQGTDAVKIHDDSKITCGRAIKQRIVSKEVYFGRDGAPVIGVLYLP